MLERQVLRTEQIAFANFAFVGYKQVTSGALFDADKIQTRFDVTRHLAVQKIQNDFSSGCGFPVPRTNGRCGHGDDCRNTLLRSVENRTFGLPFRPLVVADHFFQPGIGEFGGLLGPVYGDRRDSACVDKL